MSCDNNIEYYTILFCVISSQCTIYNTLCSKLVFNSKQVSVWWWFWLSCLCSDVHDTITGARSRSWRTAVVNYYYYHQPGPCVANKWHAIFAMIKSAGDLEKMSGFKPLSLGMQWSYTALEGRNFKRSKKKLLCFTVIYWPTEYKDIKNIIIF